MWQKGRQQMHTTVLPSGNRATQTLAVERQRDAAALSHFGAGALGEKEVAEPRFKI